MDYIEPAVARPLLWLHGQPAATHGQAPPSLRAARYRVARVVRPVPYAPDAVRPPTLPIIGNSRRRMRDETTTVPPVEREV
jgi:hypothetical protein